LLGPLRDSLDSFVPRADGISHDALGPAAQAGGFQLVNETLYMGVAQFVWGHSAVREITDERPSAALLPSANKAPYRTAHSWDRGLVRLPGMTLTFTRCIAVRIRLRTDDQLLQVRPAIAADIVSRCGRSRAGSARRSSGAQPDALATVLNGADLELRFLITLGERRENVNHVAQCSYVPQ
jgi:hypothetical protein